MAVPPPPLMVFFIWLTFHFQSLLNFNRYATKKTLSQVAQKLRTKLIYSLRSKVWSWLKKTDVYSGNAGHGPFGFERITAEIPYAGSWQLDLIAVVFHLSQSSYISDCLFHLFVKVGDVHQYYTEMVALVVTSIVLQVSSKYCRPNYLVCG